MGQLGYSPERWEEINKGGNLRNYCKEISAETGVDESKVMDTFKECVEALTPLQSTVISMYYLTGFSKVNIQYALGKPSVAHVERVLNRADKQIKKFYRIISHITNIKE